MSDARSPGPTGGQGSEQKEKTRQKKENQPQCCSRRKQD